MTPVRPKRGRVHLTRDLIKALCGRPVSGWLIAPDVPITCAHCRSAGLEFYV